MIVGGARLTFGMRVRVGFCCTGIAGKEQAVRFAVITDTHFYAPGNGRDGAWWNRTLSSRSLDIGRCLVESVRTLSPDFVIHCGDLPGTYDLRDWEAALSVMEGLGCPWYGAIGNHETWNPGIRAAFASRFGLPGDRCYHARTLGGLRFVFLDTCHWRSRDGACSPYLDRDLDFWPVYDFAQVLLGRRERPDIDVYQAVDTAAPAICAVASLRQAGALQVVPDFRPGPTRKVGEDPRPGR